MKSTHTLLAFLLCLAIFSCEQDELIDIQFVSEPEARTLHSDIYSYTFEVQGSRNVSFEVDIPEWMQYDETTQKVSGRPGLDYVNESFDFKIIAHADGNSVEQLVTVGVNLGEANCQEQHGVPSESPYTLPFREGEEYVVSQVPCAGFYDDRLFYKFETPFGTPVIASREGVVIDKRTARQIHGACAFSYVRVQHADGTILVYSNFSQRLDETLERVPGTGIEVEVGETVSKGQQLGYSGQVQCYNEVGLFVELHHEKTNYSSGFTMPLNFRNAQGDLNDNNSLRMGASYKAIN